MTSETGPQPHRRSRPFWPGSSWRILIHERTKPNSRGSYTGTTLDVHSGDRWLQPVDVDTGQREHRPGAWEFDEVVIDDWFHLEQMDDRDWWLGVGNGDDYWHINIHIDRDGHAQVNVEKQ